MAEKYIFMVIKYPKAETASMALTAINGLIDKKYARLKDAVAVTKSGVGDITLQRTQDGVLREGFLNGHLIGAIFAVLFGTEGWDMNGPLAGAAYQMLGQRIKDLLVDEFGEKMTADNSAVALLIEKADWRKALGSMRVHNFQGVAVISQNVMGELTDMEKLLGAEKNITAVPESIKLPTAKGLKYIEGIGEVYRQKLRQAGITNVDELLEKGCTVKGRREIADKTNISEKLLLRWLNMADLYRIKGIGQEYADLLEAAGVDTVPELAMRVPAHLLEKMVAANAQRKLVRHLPDLAQVESWVAQAKSLPRIINY
jgi:uncharacterized membrane protein